MELLVLFFVALPDSVQLHGDWLYRETMVPSVSLFITVQASEVGAALDQRRLVFRVEAEIIGILFTLLLVEESRVLDNLFLPVLVEQSHHVLLLVFKLLLFYLAKVGVLETQ